MNVDLPALRAAVNALSKAVAIEPTFFGPTSLAPTFLAPTFLRDLIVPSLSLVLYLPSDFLSSFFLALVTGLRREPVARAVTIPAAKAVRRPLLLDLPSEPPLVGLTTLRGLPSLVPGVGGDFLGVEVEPLRVPIIPDTLLLGPWTGGVRGPWAPREGALLPPLPVVTLELPLPCCLARSVDEVGLGVSLADALERAERPEDEVRSCLRVRDFFRGSLLLAIIYSCYIGVLVNKN